MTSRATKIAYCFLLLGLFPLCFGGAHHFEWYLCAGISSVIIAINAQKILDKNLDAKNEKYLPLTKCISRKESIGTLILCALVGLVAAYHYCRTTPHPILGPIHPLTDPFAIAGFFSGLAILLAPLFIFTTADKRLVRKTLQLSGILVSLIALAQWLSDNGLLLWIFEPEFIFESNRARWPFVNSNHLAAFLIAPTIISFDKILGWGSKILKSFPIRNKDSHYHFGRDLFHPPTLSLISFPFCLTALVAAQSRISWLVAALGIAALLIYHARRTNSGMKRWGIGLGGLVLISVVGIFSVQGSQVEELLSKRWEYSTTNSIGDHRFKLYADSLALLKAHPLLGVGPAGFAREFDSVSREELAGLNPVYLHNDVLQAVIEYGFVTGCALLFVICAALFTVDFTTFICLFGMLVVSALDFPFRIGALVAQTGMIFALGKIKARQKT